MSKTVSVDPSAVSVLGSWAASTGVGNEVAVVIDALDGTEIHPVSPLDNLLYAFPDITDAPRSAKIVSVTITYRIIVASGSGTLIPKAFINAAVVDGTTTAGLGATPTNVTQTWLPAQIANVGVYNDGTFGLAVNWTSAPPQLAKLSGTVTYELPSGGFMTLVSGLVIAGLGAGVQIARMRGRM